MRLTPWKAIIAPACKEESHLDQTSLVPQGEEANQTDNFVNASHICQGLKITPLLFRCPRHLLSSHCMPQFPGGLPDFKIQTYCNSRST